MRQTLNHILSSLPKKKSKFLFKRTGALGNKDIKYESIGEVHGKRVE